MATPKRLFAFYDTFSGLIPCRVFGIKGNDVQIKLTATRRGYKRDEILEVPASDVWPRDVSKPKRGTYGQTYIVPAYDWQERLIRK